MNLGEEVGDIVTALEAVRLGWGEVAIIEEIAQKLERRQKDNLPALRDLPKKRLLEESAKVDKVLCKFKTQSITNFHQW